MLMSSTYFGGNTIQPIKSPILHETWQQETNLYNVLHNVLWLTLYLNSSGQFSLSAFLFLYHVYWVHLNKSLYVQHNNVWCMICALVISHTLCHSPYWLLVMVNIPLTLIINPSFLSFSFSLEKIAVTVINYIKMKHTLEMTGFR